MQTNDWLLQHRNARIIVPLPVLAIQFSLPTALLVLSLVNKKIPGYAKQLLSIPLLAAVAFTPFTFSCGNLLFDAAIAAVCFNLLLRLVELYWLSPLLYGKPVYATRDYIYSEFWACLQKVHKHSRSNEDDNAKPKQYVKNKKWYHLAIKLVYNLLICDLIGCWMSTFTGDEVIMMRYDHPVLHYGYMVLFVLLLTSVFHTVGYSLSLLHCLYYDGGSYSDELWQPLINNPIISTSLEELWSGRWHQLFHTTWVAFSFRPTRHIAQRIFAKSPIKNPKPIIFILASLAVFINSGMMHEYMVASILGWSVYSKRFVGKETTFFLVNGIGVILERFIAGIHVPEKVKHSFLVRQVLQRVWVHVWTYLTFHYLMNGFAYTELWNDNPMMLTRPLIVHTLNALPYGHLLGGSLL